MFQVINRPQSQPAISEESIRKLTYRGMQYEVPQHPMPARTPVETEQLIGKHLTYRGNSYEVGPASGSDIPQFTPDRQLRYRGTTY